MHLLRSFKLDSSSRLSKHFMPHQIQWIQAEKAIHKQGKQAIALAEKSVRIGWTYADAFKNVRKRLWFKDRDYLFATKDYPSALEYVRQCYKFAEIFNLTKTILSHGEEHMAVNQLDDEGHPSSVVEQVKVGVIKFDNGSRIMAFSSNPQAMADIATIDGHGLGIGGEGHDARAVVEFRSEERRVGKECRSRWSPYH